MMLHWPGLGMVAPRTTGPEAIAASPGANGAPAGADGSQPSGDAGPSPTVADGEGLSGAGHRAEAQPGAEADDDDDDAVVSDDELSDLEFKDHPRFRALTRKANKLAKRLSRREQAWSKERDALLAKATAYDRLEAEMAHNPRLKAVFSDPDPPAPPKAEAPPPAFDPSALNLDTSDPITQALVREFQTLYKRIAELEGLRPTVQSLDQTLSAARQAAVTRQWRGAAEAAASQIDPAYREMFLDAVYGAMHVAKTRGTTVQPQQVIDHYLAKIGASRVQQKRASEAAAQATARANANLPRPNALTSGTPAPARDRSKETVRSVSQRLVGNRKAPGGYL